MKEVAERNFIRITSHSRVKAIFYKSLVILLFMSLNIKNAPQERYKLIDKLHRGGYFNSSQL